MKTSIQLIRDLDAAQKERGEAFLFVGFPTMTRLVPSFVDARLQMLEELLEQGGIPVGILTMQQTANGVHFRCDVIEEHIGWGGPYMTSFVEKMAAAAPGEVFSDSIGVDEFRSKSSDGAKVH